MTMKMAGPCTVAISHYIFLAHFENGAEKQNNIKSFNQEIAGPDSAA